MGSSGSPCCFCTRAPSCPGSSLTMFLSLSLFQSSTLSPSTFPRVPRSSPSTAGMETPSSSASGCRRTPSCCAGSCRCPRKEVPSVAPHRSPCAYLQFLSPLALPVVVMGWHSSCGSDLWPAHPECSFQCLLLSSSHFSYGSPPVINPLGTQFPSNTSVRPSYNQTLILGTALQNSTSVNLTSPAAGDWFLVAHLPEANGKIEVKVSLWQIKANNHSHWVDPSWC